MFKIAALCLLSLPFTAACLAGTELDRNAIQGLVESFMDAWNRHDAHAFAAVFAEDADFTNVRGVGATGRSKIEEFHAARFATTFKNSHQTSTGVKIRFIGADAAAVDVRWQMTGALDAQGSPGPDRNGLLSFVMERQAGGWQIVVMHNLELTAPPPLAK